MRRFPRQYTLRGIPTPVDRALRTRAKTEGKSLNQVVLETLKRGLDLLNGSDTFADLDCLIGTWKDDPEFEAALTAQDNVDEALWR